MAEVTSGYMDGYTSSAGDRLRIYWSLQSQNVENNTSTIYLKIYPVSWEAGWAEVRTTTVSRDSGAAWVYWDTSTRQWRSTNYAETTFTVTHNADGTRSLSLGAGLAYDDLSYHEVYGSWQLPTINRGLIHIQTAANTWKTGRVYVNVEGTWTPGQVFVNTASGWKRGI